MREALQLLDGEGWVDLVSAKGAFVRVPSFVEVRDVFEVRKCLEAEAARLATSSATPEGIERLRDVCSRGVAALRAGDIARVGKLNDEFHGQLAAMGGNRVLTDMLTTIRMRVRWFFMSVARDRGNDSWREHEKITIAVADGDAAEASRLIREHVEHTFAAAISRPLAHGQHEDRPPMRTQGR